ncbi:MAG: hypothetical protein NTY02_04250, partial [Acidobacteria bacterium]|nr:hypothetical protein [Acidobacteriota bacterium]
GSGGWVCTATSAPTFIEGGSWTLQIRVAVGTNTSPLSNSIPVSAGTSSPGTAWSGTGSGVVTILNDGTATGQPQMQYQANGYPVFSGNWSFSTVAPATETVNLTFAWSGGHGPYFMAATGLDVFVNRGGADVSVATLVNDGAWPCCVPPSLMFEYAGATSVAVQAGDTYGFRLRGSHYDGSYILQGTFGVKVGGTPQFAVNVRGTAGGTELDAYSIPRPVRVFGGTLAAGQQVVVTAAGMVTRATGALPNGPAGDGGTCNSGCLAPDLSPLALVARIGGGPWQLVGAGPTVLTATSPGLLEFGVNDDYFPDNSGGFIATVSWVAAPPH